MYSFFAPLARVTGSAALCAVTLLMLAALAVPDAVRAQVAVSGDLVREHEAVPGRRYTGSIQVRNPSPHAQEVEVSLSDFHFDADGTNRFERPGSLPRSLADWISFAPSRVTLAPGAETEVAYTVQVPSTTEVQSGDVLTGTYWSAIVIQGSPPRSGTAAPTDGEVGLIPRVRHAVQVAMHVDLDQEREVDLSNVQVTRMQDGNAVLAIDARNIGKLGYRPVFAVQVFDATGQRVGGFREERGLLLPDTGLRQRFDLGALPSGAYELFLTIDTGAVDLVGTQLRIDL